MKCSHKFSFFKRLFDLFEEQKVDYYDRNKSDNSENYHLCAQQ